METIGCLHLSWHPPLSQVSAQKGTVPMSVPLFLEYLYSTVMDMPVSVSYLLLVVADNFDFTRSAPRDDCKASQIGSDSNK